MSITKKSPAGKFECPECRCQEFNMENKRYGLVMLRCAECHKKVAEFDEVQFIE